MQTKNALLSVFNKDGIVEFAQELIKLGWRIFASGGTAKKLLEVSVPVTDVAELVGGEAIFGHRVVTLSREVHAGLLARPIETDLTELEKLGIPFIDLVCVDLYPLEAAIAKPDATLESVTEMTDIGGPTMLRSAAKGRRITIADVNDYKLVLDQLSEFGDVNTETRQSLAAKAEQIVACYCELSAKAISSGKYDGFLGEKVQGCKYGENAYQTPASLFSVKNNDPLALANFHLVAGTEPSYNNLCDLDRLLQTMTHIAAAFQFNHYQVPLIAIAVKHGNACGAATGADSQTILQKTVMGDPRAIFGGLIMTNFDIDGAGAEILLHHGVTAGKRLLDGVIAPAFTNEAIDQMKRKADKCRFLVNHALANLSAESLDKAFRFRYVRGGFLREPNYTYILNLSDPQWKISGDLIERRWVNFSDLLLAWAINATSNSNTITLVKNSMLIGNGVGQQDRVGAAELAIKKARDAGHVPAGATAVSDSFFPFPDGPQRLIEAGIKVILATTGSVKDEEIKKVITVAGLTFITLPDSVARGFFGH